MTDINENEPKKSLSLSRPGRLELTGLTRTHDNQLHRAQPRA